MHVDFVLTFKEVAQIFEAVNINPSEEKKPPVSILLWREESMLVPGV